MRVPIIVATVLVFTCTADAGNFTNYCVARITVLTNENALLQSAPEGRSIFRSNNYQLVTYFPGQRIDQYVVTSVDTSTYMVKMSDGTNYIDLFAPPGVQTNITAVLVPEVPTPETKVYKLCIMDVAPGGFLVTRIATDGTVYCETAFGEEVTFTRCASQQAVGENGEPAPAFGGHPKTTLPAEPAGELDSPSDAASQP